MSMIFITFPDQATMCRALDILSGRFAFKSWATGEMMVPEDALAQLTLKGIQFTEEGRLEFPAYSVIDCSRLPPI